MSKDTTNGPGARNRQAQVPVLCSCSRSLYKAERIRFYKHAENGQLFINEESHAHQASARMAFALLAAFLN